MAGGKIYRGPVDFTIHGTVQNSWGTRARLKNRGATSFFGRQKRRAETFFDEEKPGGFYFFSLKKGRGHYLYSFIKKVGNDFFLLVKLVNHFLLTVRSPSPSNLCHC